MTIILSLWSLSRTGISRPSSLKELRQRMPLEAAAFIAAEACAGLDFAHRKRTAAVDHSTLFTGMSLQNILVSYDDEAKIVDFGIAKATH